MMVKTVLVQFCRTPEYACTLTLQPLERYRGKLDAVIIFSDILIVLQVSHCARIAVNVAMP